GVLLLMLAQPRAVGQEKLLWGGLQPGPHAVGLATLYQFDYARRYDPEFGAGRCDPRAERPRPILVNIWYPAKKVDSGPMPDREYLKVESDDPRAIEFSRRLPAHTRRAITQETMEKSPGQLDADESAAIERLLETRTYAVRDAPAEDGRYPLGVNHQ